MKHTGGTFSNVPPHSVSLYKPRYTSAPAILRKLHENKRSIFNMFKTGLLLLAVFSFVSSNDARRRRHDDPFAALDHHLTHSLAYHYLWPWTQLMQAAAALDEQNLEEPKIVSDAEKFEVSIYAKRFKPNELRVRVKNHFIMIEGRRKEQNPDLRFLANHFEQRFALPRGSNPEEVTAVLKENGVLTVSVPKHELPPERIVPIEVRLKLPEEKPEETTTEKIDKLTETDKKDESPEAEKVIPAEPSVSSSAPPIEQEIMEATTHVGKIRKKELKSTTTKATKDNEVSKVESNGLDYALIEAEE